MVQRTTVAAALSVIAATLTLNASKTHAQEGSVSVALAQCARVSDAADRLACFDAMAKRFEAGMDTSQDRSVGAGVTNSEKKKDRAAEFGLPKSEPAWREPEAATIDRLDFKIERFEKDKYGKVTVTLDNGQVWRQLSSDDVRPLLNPRKSYTGTIKRGLVGNYMMRINESHESIRVRRVR